MAQYEYMVKICANGKPSLVRVGEDHVFRGYDPREPEKWVEDPRFVAFAWGGGDFINYDDCSESQAMEYMKKIEAFWAGKP